MGGKFDGVLFFFTPGGKFSSSFSSLLRKLKNMS